MMLNNTKEYIKNNKNKMLNFIFYGTRGQNEEFKGVINGTYNNVFTILLENGITKSFTYSDYLVGNIQIIG